MEEREVSSVKMHALASGLVAQLILSWRKRFLATLSFFGRLNLLGTLWRAEQEKQW